MKRPTFEQFVDYLLRTDVSEYNDHWIPIWLHCRICLMEFDVIGEHKLMQNQYFCATRLFIPVSQVGDPH